jgi:Spy/CpxP family protein refolding chaperone
MRQTRSRTTILIAAAFLAAALVPAFAAAQEGPQAAVPARPRLERGPLAGLGLTPDQVKSLEAFRKARAVERRTYREEMAKLRDEMSRLRQDPQADRSKLDALIDKRAGLVAGHQKAAVRARIERNKIFTPGQLEKLRSVRPRRDARGLSGRAWMGRGRAGRFPGLGPGLRHRARWRALRDRTLFRRGRW